MLNKKVYFNGKTILSYSYELDFQITTTTYKGYYGEVTIIRYFVQGVPVGKGMFQNIMNSGLFE